MRHHLQTYGIALTLLLLVSGQGCSVGPAYTPPELAPFLQKKWQAAAAGTFPGSEPEILWWRQFKDPQLNALITQMFSSGLALQAAEARVAEVSARHGVVAADQQLQLAAALGYTRAETGDETVTLQSYPPGKTVDLFSAGVIAGWELDLWGRTAHLLDAAEADVRTAFSEYQAMLVSLAAEMSLAYVELRTMEARQATVAHSITLQENRLQLARDRYQAGNGAAMAVADGERLLENTRARLPAIEMNINSSQNRIQVLLGQPPAAKSIRAGTMPEAPPLPGLGIPADLLTRRADIRQALHRYQAAVARIGAAEAERYPSLSLSGTLTLSSDSLGGVFDPESLYYTLGPGLKVPLLNGGRIDSNVGVRTSQAEQARLALAQKLVEAVAEVETSAAGALKSSQQTRRLAGAAEAAARSVALAESLFQAGLVDYSRVLDSQQQLTTSQEALLVARQQELSDHIRLYRALGGGWQLNAATVEETDTSLNDFTKQEDGDGI